MTTPRTCPTCGAQVSAKERFCANCGSRLPDPPAEPPAEPPAQPPEVSPTIRLDQPETEATQLLPPPRDPAPPPSQPSYGLPASSTPPPSQPSYGLPTSPTPPQEQAPLGVPPAVGAPPASQGRRMSPWLIALLALGGLCAIACVAVFVGLNMLGQQVSAVFVDVGTSLALTSAAEPSSNNQGGAGGIVDLPTREPVATPEEEPTVAEEPTAEAEPTAAAAPTTAGSGGIIGGGVAAGGASLAQTSAAATAAAVQGTAEIEQFMAGASVVFRDEFVDNRNNWFTGFFEEIEEDRIEGGVFKVIWSANGSSYELYEVRELTNFIAEVDCLIAQGGVDASCGLVFGQKPDIGFYKFEVFEDYYRLFVVQVEGDPPVLTEGDPAGIIKPGAPNRLRVIKRGDEIRLYLNDTLLDTLSDATYPTGKVGVSTNSYIESGPAEIWFDNFSVWQLP